MPSRPIALQKVYEAELFFLGQSFRIYSEDKTQHTQLNKCRHAYVCVFRGFSEGHGAYQQQVIKEKDLSLELGQFLFMRLVGIRHLKQTTAAHQTPVRHGKDLHRRGEKRQR